MLDGLELFSSGLWKQAQKRAADDEVTLKKSISMELEEMSFFLSLLYQMPDEQRRDAIIGVALLARFLYQNISRVEDPDEMRRRFLEDSKILIDFLRRMDDAYYADLRPGRDPKDALKLLGEWIQSH